VQENDFERLRLRTLYGAGPRLAIVHGDDVEIHYGVGYMLEFERIDVLAGAPDEASTWAHRLTNYVAIAVRIDDTLRFTSTTYFQPRFDEPSDYRMLSESALAVGIGKRLFTKLSATVRFDSEPPTAVRSTDVELQNSFGANF
jgi:hypothetical protein